jgi:hypothetical protein
MYTGFTRCGGQLFPVWLKHAGDGWSAAGDVQKQAKKPWPLGARGAGVVCAGAAGGLVRCDEELRAASC